MYKKQWLIHTQKEGRSVYQHVKGRKFEIEETDPTLVSRVEGKEPSTEALTVTWRELCAVLWASKVRLLPKVFFLAADGS